MEKVIPFPFGSSVTLYISFCTSWGFSEVLSIKQKKKREKKEVKMTWEDISEAGPHRTCMVKRLVRAGSISVRLPFSQFSNALRAVKPVNPFLPSCSGAQQHHADSWIWQERGLALQKELCKQRHLLPQYSPASSSSPAQITQGTATLWTWNRGYCTAKLSLQHISKYTHEGIPPPRHHPAFALRHRAPAPGSSGSQERQRKVGSQCSVSSTIPWPLAQKAHAAPS